jgi:hypothetical protein
MDMFLMVLAISLFGVAVSAILFLAAARPSRAQQAPAPEVRLATAPARFFVDDRVPLTPAMVSVEALLLQIERHVRIEQAAAEYFHAFPTAEALHMKTTSPLFN